MIDSYVHLIISEPTSTFNTSRRFNEDVFNEDKKVFSMKTMQKFNFWEIRCDAVIKNKINFDGDDSFFS